MADAATDADVVCRLARRQTTLVFELGFIVALFMGFPGYVLHWRSTVNLGTSVRMYDWQKKIPYIGQLTQLVFRCATSPLSRSHPYPPKLSVWWGCEVRGANRNT